MKTRFLWIFLNPYGWLIFGMSIVTAVIVETWWVVLLGIIGYQTVLLVEMLWGRHMGKSGAIQLSQAKQENRELHAEQARLLGAIQSRDLRLRELEDLAKGEPVEEDHGEENRG